MSEQAYLADRRARELEVTKAVIPASMRFTRAHGLTYAPKALGGRVMRAPIRRVDDIRNLGPNEYLHGTSREGAAKIREQGFRLADPRGPRRGGDALRADSAMFAAANEGRTARTTTRAGRPRAAGDLGPGVYLTKHPRTAKGFAGYVDTRGKLSHLLLPRGRGEVLRVKVDPSVRNLESYSGSKTKTPQAARRGYGAVEEGQPHRAMHQVAVGDPRKVTPVNGPKRWAAGWTPGEYAAATAGVGGAGYGGHKLHERNQAKKGQLKKVGR